MKRNILFMFIAISALLLSCEKQNDGPGEIYGTWKLTEQLSDPGDGSGKYRKVKNGKEVTFKSDGKVEGDALGDFVSFKLLDGNKIELTRSSPNEKLTYLYAVDGKTLTLNPPCIEACGMRFKRK